MNTADDRARHNAYRETPTLAEARADVLEGQAAQPIASRGFCRFWDENERGRCGWFLDEHKYDPNRGWQCPSEAS